MTDPALYPCFLGPYGENDGLLEKLVVEFLRDHVYWRRNVHPEDPPAIPTSATLRADFQAFEARLRRELHALSAALKRSVPFHSPRYLGHMVSDLALPGLVAQVLALPYNPNNVTEEAGPVTIDLEIRAGLQLAHMLGYCDDTARPDCAFGHLTSGGTVANYQALRLALALKAFPLALRAAGFHDPALPKDDYAAFNLHPQAAIALLQRARDAVAALAPEERRQWQQRIESQRIEHLGQVEFFARHRQIAPPVVLAPLTAHYSWNKGMKLLGLGHEQLLQVPERGMRMDAQALVAQLEQLQRERRSVLLAVAVLGTTEFGTIDPIHAVVAARERFSAQGLGFAVHVDAAWGGYLASLLRQQDGGLRPLAELRREFTTFPSETTHAAIAAIGQCDSVTVDPHKLGFLPYGAGAFICRDQRAMGLLSESADYVFAEEGVDDYFRRYRQLGRYIPEGSKSGAAAAAVYVTHRVMPLDAAHFGRMVAETIRSTERFIDHARRMSEAAAARVHACVPFAPDSNLVCLALNPVGNRDVAVANAFVRRVYESLRIHHGRSVQEQDFYASMTSLHAQAVGAEDMAGLLARLDLDPATLRAGHDGADRLFILRHTLMNPFLLDDQNGIDYIARYFDYLQRRCGQLLDEGTSP